MTRSLLAGLGIALLVGATSSAQDAPSGASTSPPVIPESRYVISTPPVDVDIAQGGKERPQAVNGTTYDVIAPIFTGADENVSYIRLANANGVTATFTVLVVGSPSGNTYGTASYQVPARASPQYSYDQVLQRAGVAGLQAGDTAVSFYLRSSHFYTGYQHVIFNNTSKFFENLSRCRFVANSDYSVFNNLLANIHTSTVAALGYPATVTVHNNAATSTTFSVNVLDAATGASKGTFAMTASANTTYAFPFSYFEEQVDWTPTAAEGHANLLFVPSDSSTSVLTLGQAIYNQTYKSYVNMSQFCGANY